MPCRSCQKTLVGKYKELNLCSNCYTQSLKVPKKVNLKAENKELRRLLSQFQQDDKKKKETRVENKKETQDNKKKEKEPPKREIYDSDIELSD